MSTGKALWMSMRNAARKAVLLMTALLAVAAASPAEADCSDRGWACANGDISIGACYQFWKATCEACHSDWQNQCRQRDLRCDDGETPARRIDGCSAGDPIYKRVFEKACNEHDACYSTPGRTKASCDSNFLDNMRTLCHLEPTLEQVFAEGGFGTCQAAALTYYEFVKGRHEAQDGYDGDQIWAKGMHCGDTGPRRLVFEREAGSSSQTLSYWAGSALPQGGGGPVPNFVNPPQPAWIDIAPGGSHTIQYADSQPIALQDVFFNIIKDNKSDRAICVVSAKLNGTGKLTGAQSNCPSSIVVRTEQDRVVVTLPSQI